MNVLFYVFLESSLFGGDRLIPIHQVNEQVEKSNILKLIFVYFLEAEI